MDATPTISKDLIHDVFKNKYEDMSDEQMAEEAVVKACNQLIASTEFKAPRLKRISRYYALYNGEVKKKLRQLFNVAIPIFPGMIDTLNAQHDSPIQVRLEEGNAADYFKVKKIDGMFQKETTNTSENTKWDSKLRISRKDAIFCGRGVVRYSAESDPEYKSELRNVKFKNFHFQPRGGGQLENHLFAGEEGIERTKDDLVAGVKAGRYDKDQVIKLLNTASQSEYLPEINGIDDAEVKLERFKPLGIDPTNSDYVGETVYALVEWVLRMGGERYYIVFEPWTRTWLRFEKLTDVNSSGLMLWDSWATHYDDENFMSKSYSDDLYKSCDAIVALFNQELTNREKKNFQPRAYDKDMFKDVRKLDEASHRPDALIPVDTKNGTRRISEGIYEFKTGDLIGTVNLIDWITGSLGRNTGANDLAQGSVQSVSKKASVTFAEQKSVSKRLSWAAASFQEMMESIVNKYIWGLKDHMPSEVAIQLLGQTGWDWDQITRLDLDTTKDIDVIILSSDQEIIDSDMKSKKRQEVLGAIAADPNLAAIASPQWRLEQMLRTAEFSDVEIAVAMDSKSYADRKALSHAAESIQLILQEQKPDLWFGASIAFMQKIVDFASDNRATLKGKYDKLLAYSSAHAEIVKSNMSRKVSDDQMLVNAPNELAPTASQPQQKSGLSGGVSRAMAVGQEMVS